MAIRSRYSLTNHAVGRWVAAGSKAGTASDAKGAASSPPAGNSPRYPTISSISWRAAALSVGEATAIAASAASAAPSAPLRANAVRARRKVGAKGARPAPARSMSWRHIDNHTSTSSRARSSRWSARSSSTSRAAAELSSVRKPSRLGSSMRMASKRSRASRRSSSSARLTGALPPRCVISGPPAWQPALHPSSSRTAAKQLARLALTGATVAGRGA